MIIVFGFGRVIEGKDGALADVGRGQMLLQSDAAIQTVIGPVLGCVAKHAVFSQPRADLPIAVALVIAVYSQGDKLEDAEAAI